MLCVRLPAPLSEQDARALASMIGPVKDPVGRTRAGGLLRYSDERQIVDAGFVLTDELRAQLGDLNFGGDSVRPGLFETFHTDDTYTERPALATVLHARELPSGPGGDTQFIDMRAAYRLLDANLRDRLLGLRTVHTYNNGVFPPRVAAEGPFEELVDVAHPVVRAHPVTGAPALYFDLDRATRIEGMPDDEGRRACNRCRITPSSTRPAMHTSWRPHDVLIWDNASVQHKAGGDFPVGEPRNFWRYMIEGPVPAATPRPGAECPGVGSGGAPSRAARQARSRLRRVRLSAASGIACSASRGAPGTGRVVTSCRACSAGHDSAMPTSVVSVAKPASHSAVSESGGSCSLVARSSICSAPSDSIWLIAARDRAERGEAGPAHAPNVGPSPRGHVEVQHRSRRRVDQPPQDFERDRRGRVPTPRLLRPPRSRRGL